MSHHFDTPTAREDPRINVCDFYLFRGKPGFTVMAVTVNPNAGQSVPDTFRDEGLYAFRFDLDGDTREELSFTVRFGAVFHSDDDNHAHAQSFEVRRASGSAATSSADGELIAAGHIGSVVEAASGVRALAGLAPDLFAGDAVALGEFRTAFFEKRDVSSRGVSKPEEFLRRTERDRNCPRGPEFHDWTRSRAWLGHGVASWPRAGGPGLPMGPSTDNKHLHA